MVAKYGRKIMLMEQEQHLNLAYHLANKYTIIVNGLINSKNAILLLSFRAQRLCQNWLILANNIFFI